MASDGSGSGDKRPGSGLDDTVPASEPPLDIEGKPMRGSRASIPPFTHQRYRLGAELGRGGMGRVVEAFDTQLGRTVALKEVLPRGDSVARRFIREIEITARLEHASIVPIYDSGTTSDGRPFYVMRRVTGRPLDELIRRGRGLDERLTLVPNLLAAIDAVAHAHKRGVIHRDLKPANILVGELGETVVIDWGLAKVIGEVDDADANEARVPTAADSLQTQIGSVFGTPGFMAPEQARGEELDTRGDVYALGATLYHMLAGKPPHTGSSATDVIGRTLLHDVPPLAESAPGAPPELVAITDKAMGFDADTRYPNAGALAEDVRRFLAGQLVAAHRYTSRQRIARFAKRHRTPLAVVALAALAVAALAWFSVHRIVEERDAATAARRDAVAGQRTAEAALDSLADRTDALLLTQARALLDTNPTEALAVLKQLAPDSKQLGAAAAVGQAAVTRGVWSAIQSVDAITIRAELAPDGRHLLQVSVDDVLRVWDLERMRLVIARPLPGRMTALWVSGGRVLVYARGQQPFLLDPAANQTMALAGAPIRTAVATETGDRVLMLDDANVPALLELATQVRVPLWDGRPVTSYELAPDGTWLVLADRSTVVALDAAGAELVRVSTSANRVVASSDRRFAIADGTHVRECKLDPKPVCAEIPFAAQPRPLLVDMRYRGPELAMYLASGDVMAWDGEHLSSRLRVDQFMGSLGEAAGGTLVIPSFTGKIHLHVPGVLAHLTLPVPVSYARIVVRRTSSRVVVVGEGLILVTDLGPVLPQAIVAAADVVFLDDNTLVGWGLGGSEWVWIDLSSGTRTRARMQPRGLMAVVDHDPTRVLAIDEAGPRSRLLVLSRSEPPREVAAGPGLWGRLVPGGAVVFAREERGPDGRVKPDGRVYVKIGDDEARELVKLDGNVEGLVALGPNRFAAISSGGEVVRGDLASGMIERVRATAAEGSFVGGDALGRTVVVVEDRLYIWGDRLELIARFDKAIRRTMRADGGGLVVMLVDHDAFLVPAVPGATPERLLAASQYAPVVSRDGKTLVGTGNGLQVTVVEIASRARWMLPRIYAATHQLQISPTTRTVAQGAHSMQRMWTLPVASSDLAAWLDEKSNAMKDGDAPLAWSWQLRKP